MRLLTAAWCPAAAALLAAMGGGCSGSPGASFAADSTESEPAPPLPAETGTLQFQVDETSGDVAISSVLVVENPANALSFFAEWKTAVVSACSLRLVCPDVDISIPGEVLATKHSAFVMGLYAGANCTLTLTAETAEGKTGTAVGSLAVGSLPGFLPELSIEALDPDRMQPGWTLFNVTNSFDDPPLVVAMVDEFGRYRWYHRRATHSPGCDADTRALAEGILVGGTSGHNFPALIDWEGNVVWEKKVSMHHELQPIGDEGHLLYLVDTAGCDLGVKSGAVVEYDPATDREVWFWKLCDYYQPAVVGSDWSHVNAAALPADESYMLVSARNQNALFKVTLHGGELLWKLGADGDFTMAEEAVFFRQHGPEIQPDGTILLFDNGMKGAREYSRALQIKLDEKSKQVTRVWEYRYEPDLFSPVWGDADRLPNGNTLVLFGQHDTHVQARVVEVTPAGEQVWNLAMPVKWSGYRAERVAVPILGYRR